MSSSYRNSRCLSYTSRILRRKRDPEASSDRFHRLQRSTFESHSKQNGSSEVYRTCSGSPNQLHRQHKKRRESTNSSNNFHRFNKGHNENRRSSLTNILEDMLEEERHHIALLQKDSSGKIVDVMWCPYYVHPEMKGKARGGKAILHHTCRVCHRICLHLLGKPFSSNRRCLGCEENAFRNEDIPKWYYHQKKCSLCKQWNLKFYPQEWICQWPQMTAVTKDGYVRNITL